jgi:hypothetical protein
MKNFHKYPAGILALGVAFLSPLSSSGEEAGRVDEQESEVELEGDPLITRQFIEEAQREEDRSRKKLISYGADVPTVISWCVREDLLGKHGCKDVRVLSVIRGGENWALATSKGDGVLYYTAMEKPRDNIRILGSSTQLQGAVDLIPSSEGKDEVSGSLDALKQAGGDLSQPSEAKQ